MLNFSFHNPTRIHFGDSQVQKIDNEIPKDAVVLLIYGGGSIKKNSVFDQVIEALGEHEWHEFSGIKPNPSYDFLIKSLPLIKEKNIRSQTEVIFS